MYIPTSYLIIGTTVISIFIYFVFQGKKPNDQTIKNVTPEGTGTTIENISKDSLDKLLGDSEVVILDIRAKEEFDSGHLARAQNIDFYASNFESMLNNLDKSKKYLVYCRSGSRSGKAMEIMKRLKFNSVYNLSGGITTVNSNQICTTDC